MSDKSERLPPQKETETILMKVRRVRLRGAAEGESDRTIEISELPTPSTDTPPPRKRKLKKRAEQPQVAIAVDYRQLIEGVYDGVLITDLGGKIMDCNGRSASMLDYTEDELRLLHLVHVVVGADFAFVDSIVETLRESKRIIIEAECVDRGKSIFPAEITVHRLQLSPAGELCFFIRNISRRVDAERALRTSERRFRTIAESMSDWVWETDDEGICTFCSDRITAVLGLSVADVVGRPLVDVEDSENGAALLKLLNNSRQRLRNVQVWLLDAENSRRCISFSGSPRKTEEGEFVGFTGIAADVTERKETEETLMRYREHLEELVDERTVELKAAVSELERTNKELEEFAYVASHDLQEPLRKVASFTQLLERRYRGELDDRADEFIEFIVDGSKRMQTMISDLLRYSRVGTQSKPFRATDCNQVVDIAISNLEFSIAENAAMIEVGNLPTVKADETQLVQLFQNLLANAVKFRRDLRPQITISATPVKTPSRGAPAVDSDDPPCWKFTVRDNGIGIEESYIDRIFTIFSRLHNRSDYPGTGIGLSICKKIVDRHGGQIWVSSEPGVGSAFSFTIPTEVQAIDISVLPD